MGRWVLQTAPEMIPVTVTPGEFDRVLAAISEILYKCFCQLDPKSVRKTVQASSIATNVITGRANRAAKQTEASQ